MPCLKANVSGLYRAGISSAYALFCGLVFIGVVALMLAPVMHRVMHKFHLDDADSKK